MAEIVSPYNASKAKQNQEHRSNHIIFTCPFSKDDAYGKNVIILAVGAERAGLNGLL